MSKQLVKSTGLMGLMTFCSRILGYIRDMMIAHQFGATGDIDAFLIAFKIPNFMRRLFAEGAFSQAFVPVLAGYQGDSAQALKSFIDRVAGNLLLCTGLVAGMGMILAPWFIKLFAPGFELDAGRFAHAVAMLRITFPYLILISMTAFFSGILNSLNRFAVTALTPIFLNIAMILCLVYVSQSLAVPVFSLAWGVLLGGCLQVLFTCFFLHQAALLPKLRVDWRDPGVKRILKLMAPALLGVSVNQLNLIIDSSFASYLTTGSVSWLYYADRLMEFPLGIFGVAIATVALPRMAILYTNRDEWGFSATLDWGLRMVILLGGPSALGLGLLAQPLIASLFQSGHFSAVDVCMSAQSLQAYALGIVGFMLVKVLGSAFYARHNIATPVKFALLTMVTHLVLNLTFIGPFKHAGLALATSLASLVNAGGLLWYLKAKRYYSPAGAWGRYLLQVAVACSTMALVICYLNPSLNQWLSWNRVFRLRYLSLIVMAGGASYVISLYVMGVRPKQVLIPARPL